jgi:hypothetical protein
MAKGQPHFTHFSRGDRRVAPTCAAHDLWHAHAPTPSADGTRVYVLCACGRPRVVTPEAWQAEVERRDAASGHDEW